MDPDFWHQRWRDNQIGFHQERVTPLLEQYWSTLALPRGSRVFVPLAGKTLDMPWLCAQGHRVLGVELSRIAVEQFFDEHALQPTLRESRYGTHFAAGDIELVCGDVFALDAEALADCAAVYDRAALIALPPDMRERYVRGPLARLPGGCRGLLVTVEYPQQEKAGPPFSVDADEVQALYGRDWQVELLERRDILAAQPGFIAEGVTQLYTSAWRLETCGRGFSPKKAQSGLKPLPQGQQAAQHSAVPVFRESPSRPGALLQWVIWHRGGIPC